jgi:hypothetical protein
MELDILCDEWDIRAKARTALLAAFVQIYQKIVFNRRFLHYGYASGRNDGFVERFIIAPEVHLSMDGSVTSLC